jgi:anti-sigma factor RsiW
MSEPSSHLDTRDDELLVAYLDGELDAEAVRGVDDRLAAEPVLRARLRQLEQPWRMLDELSAEPVAEDFTRTTLEMVATAAAEDTEQHERAARGRPSRRRWLAAGGLVGAAAAGFLAVVLLRPDPNRQLAEDLPVLEHFEAYRQTESVEFLRQLHDQGLFDEE